MAEHQPSASLADRDASRSHGSMMTERDEGTHGPRLAQVEHQRAGFGKEATMSDLSELKRPAGTSSEYAPASGSR
jgi:hypothetical protein